MTPWVPVIVGLALGAGALLWLGIERHRRQPHLFNEKRVSWRLVLPREARFGLAEATAWFAALAPHLAREGPRPSVELCGEGREVVMHLIAPAAWEAPLRGQLAAWFPCARLERCEVARPAGVLAVLPLRLERPALYPLRLPQPKEPDPLLGVLGALTQRDEDCGLRLTWGPAPSDWSRWVSAALTAARSGGRLPPRGAWLWVYLIAQLLRQGTAASDRSSRPVPTRTPALVAAAAKARDPVFDASVCVWARGKSRDEVTRRATELAAHLRVGYRDPAGNALVAAGTVQTVDSLQALDRAPQSKITLSAAELGALFHLPVTDHPLIPREPSRHAAPASRLLSTSGSVGDITWWGEALTPERPVPFGLDVADRRHHSYLLGKTGTGKSTLLATIARQDLEAGRGVGLIDPHGDLAERMLTLVPPDRYDHVLYFNPADTDFPIGFNLLAATTPTERPLVASGVVGVFKKLYSDFWGPRLEYILRNALLVLLETPAPSLLGVPRLLTDREYRQRLLPHVRDPILRTFFLEEFERYDPRWRAEAIAPILNKVNQFLASPVVRHVVGQSRRGFNLRQIMDHGGVFIANLASGRIGEDNAALLGGLLVAGFQLAAMARADQPEEQRRDFFLFVDEFQHFANEAFAGILSEARKYRLSLTLSHQYLDQVPPALSDAVLGNVGSLAVFRVGAPDTTRLVRELAPVFDAQDLVHLPDHQFCARITRTGETSTAFSARTIPLPETTRDIRSLIERSRARWARPRAEVELEIADAWEGRVD
jgi:Helicase HerA, central domain